jgi:uncharacterized protein
MRYIYTTTLLLFFKLSLAQIFIPIDSIRNSGSKLKEWMPILAKNVLKNYKENNLITYHNNTYRLNTVAGLISEALNSIKIMRNIIYGRDSLDAKGFCFQFESYNISKSIAIRNRSTLEQAFTNNFLNNYSKLNTSASLLATAYFDFDIKKVKNNFLSKLNLIKRDTISLEEAVELCTAYSYYLVYSDIGAEAKKILQQEEERLFIIEDSVLIKMRDGAKISIVIVRKRDITIKLPSIFIFNIYASKKDRLNAKQIASEGYVGIVANTRGKHLSNDSINPFEYDANDAYDIIDWISKQSWSNGKVGMHGGSYLGFSQWAAAKSLHPALKTIVPQVSVCAGVDFPLQNGIFMTYMLKWIHYVSDNKYLGEDDEDKWIEAVSKWYKSGLPFSKLDSIYGGKNSIFKKWISHPSFDNYWKKMTPQKNEFSKINIPILSITGYYDDDQIGALHYFKEHYNWNNNANHYLLIGPYSHGGAGEGYPTEEIEGYRIDSVANFPIRELIYQWFDYTLKDSIKPEILKDKINYEVMDKNEWKHVSSMSKMYNDSIIFYLDNKISDASYSLSTKKPIQSEPIEQIIDLKDRSEMQFVSGEDVSVFQNIVDTTLNIGSEKLLESTLEISGAFSASLLLNINKRDIDVAIAMYEKTPDGKFFGLSSSVQRASYSKNLSKRNLLTPNKKTRIVLTNSYITSKLIKKGSQLIIVLGSNHKDASWQTNYGTGKDVSTESIKDAGAPLQIKWYNDSYIKIPVWRPSLNKVDVEKK